MKIMIVAERRGRVSILLLFTKATTIDRAQSEIKVLIQTNELLGAYLDMKVLMFMSLMT